MEEQQIIIKNDDFIIEGLLEKSPTKFGVVICHPHPLMGGSMHNNVVEAIQEAFASLKYSTLRFNFRGVGRSTGCYDEGRGEQEDIFAARQYLFETGISEISFAGYSFGAWVGSKAMEMKSDLFNYSLFVSPPVSYFDFDFSKLNNKIRMIICGDRDEFCDLSLLRKEINNLKIDLKIISGADHFYQNRERELIRIIKEHMIHPGM